jgi:5-methyltetrahydrofolate--homocysteine methyltransferase
MRRLMDRVRSGETIISDGALGSQLMARGVSVHDCLDAASLNRPELLREIAAAYLDAGAEILTTNTFGASPLKLASYGLDDRTDEINRRAVELLRDVAADRAWVAGSVGPTGRILLPYGDTQAELVEAAFERQIAALAGAGADAIFVETMIDLNEARLAISAAQRTAPDLPVVATMTFDATPRGFFTTMGVTVLQAAQGLAEAGAQLVGSNCGNGIEVMVAIGREFSRHSPVPFAIQSNAGQPEHRDGELVWPESPDFMAEGARALLDSGVSILGGCCGTGPEHIRALRELVDRAE